MDSTSDIFINARWPMVFLLKDDDLCAQEYLVSAKKYAQQLIDKFSAT